MELVELTEIVGLVPLLIESQVDERERNVIGESPMKLGGRDVRFCGQINAWGGKEMAQKEKKRQKCSRVEAAEVIKKNSYGGVDLESKFLG